jgi:hypothetical protein
VNLQLSGLPALAIQIGFIVVFSAPVWLAARIVGAEHPTLIRAALSLLTTACQSQRPVIAMPEVKSAPAVQNSAIPVAMTVDRSLLRRRQTSQAPTSTSTKAKADTALRAIVA